MANTITTPPDPENAAAIELAQVLRARQSRVRIIGGSAVPVQPTSREESRWLTEYGVAEAAKRRRDREAYREARRAEMRGEL